ILGLDAALVARIFPATPSAVGGLTLRDIATLTVDRHARAIASSATVLEYPGLHGYRRDGEYHATNPVVVRGLQKARDAALGTASDRSDTAPAYETFKSHVHG